MAKTPEQIRREHEEEARLEQERRDREAAEKQRIAEVQRRKEEKPDAAKTAEELKRQQTERDGKLNPQSQAEAEAKRDAAARAAEPKVEMIPAPRAGDVLTEDQAKLLRAAMNVMTAPAPTPTNTLPTPSTPLASNVTDMPALDDAGRARLNTVERYGRYVLTMPAYVPRTPGAAPELLPAGTEIVSNVAVPGMTWDPVDEAAKHTVRANRARLEGRRQTDEAAKRGLARMAEAVGEPLGA